MATYSVSGQSQLLSTLKTVKSGDILKLAGGNYGSVSLTSAHSGITLTSANDANQAVFSKISATKTSNLVIDNVTFDGVGGTAAGTGLTINNATNVKVLNSDFTDLKAGSYFYDITGLTVSNNNFTRMYWDAMDFADIQGGVISKNTYQESGSQLGYIHKDFIQFWTNEGYDQRASSNVEIFNNSFYSKDGNSHGIFIHNEWMAQKHQNINIHDNLIKSSQSHGITVTYGDNIEIRNNTVVQDGDGTPTINVTPDSTNVRILYNTAPSVAHLGNETWTIEHNKETAGNVYQWTNGLTEGIKINNVGPYYGVLDAAGAPVDPTFSNGLADSFQFKGTSVVGNTSSSIWGLSFAEGDTITFNYYESDTFEYKYGGNALAANTAGTYVKIDSLVDIQELAAMSPKVDVTVDGDTLLLSIAQAGGAQTIAIDGWGEEYITTYNELLF